MKGYQAARVIYDARLRSSSYDPHFNGIKSHADENALHHDLAKKYRHI